MSEPLRFCKVTLAATQGFFDAPALRDIDHRSNHLNKLSRGTQDGMADAMNVFDCSIRFNDPELDVAVHFLKEHPVSCQPELLTIFRVDSLRPLLPGR